MLTPPIQTKTKWLCKKNLIRPKPERIDHLGVKQILSGNKLTHKMIHEGQL